MHTLIAPTKSNNYIWKKQIVNATIVSIKIIVSTQGVCRMENIMTKKQRTIEIINRLKEEYPVAECTLDYNEAWKLLVSVSLAAQ